MAKNRFIKCTWISQELIIGNEPKMITIWIEPNKIKSFTEQKRKFLKRGFHQYELNAKNNLINALNNQQTLFNTNSGKRIAELNLEIDSMQIEKRILNFYDSNDKYIATVIFSSKNKLQKFIKTKLNKD